MCQKTIKFNGLENQFHYKNYIFSKAEFITDKLQFQDYEKKSSIGYLFLQTIQQNHKKLIDDVKIFWYSSKKHFIQQSMRTATQYKLRVNQYESVRIMCVFIIQNIHVIVILQF